MKKMFVPCLVGLYVMSAGLSSKSFSEDACPGEDPVNLVCDPYTVERVPTGNVSEPDGCESDEFSNCKPKNEGDCSETAQDSESGGNCQAPTIEGITCNPESEEAGSLLYNNAEECDIGIIMNGDGCHCYMRETDDPPILTIHCVCG